MTDATKKWFWIVLALVLAAALTVAVFWAVRQAQRRAGAHVGLIKDEQLSHYLNSKDVLAAGAVQDSEGRVVDGATVTLSLYNGSGQVVCRLVRPVEQDGSFKIQIQDLPALPNIYAATLAAEAPNYLAEKADVSVEISGSILSEQAQLTASPTPQASTSVTPAPSVNPARPTQVSPRRIRLKLVSYSPWLTLIVLTPALLGLLLAIVHLNQFNRGIWVTYIYSLGVAFLWALVVGSLGWLYLTGNSLIPLFWPDLFVSSGIVIFAFIGNIIYVAYTIAEKRHSFFDANETKRRGLLLRLGGRIIIAPYVALVAYGIFAATFPTLRTGPFAAFFGFFSGLWIKPILEALNDIGLRLLSVEERQKVAAEATRAENEDAPPSPGSSPLPLRPEQGFLDAVNAAREELLKKKNVIGVAPGLKETALEGKTGRRAIVAYVYEKKDPESESDRVPATFMGFPTDVVPLPQADESGRPCREVAFNLSWEKINRDHEAELAREPHLPHDSSVNVVGQIAVLADPSGFVTINSRNHKELDAVRAFQLVKPRIGDSFDFVAFIVDRASGLPYIGNYNVPIHNEIKGINHFKGDSYSVRADWGTKRLLAVQVFSFTEPDFRTYLHELAHTWCAYATFNDPVAGTSHSQELLMLEDPTDQALLHWGEKFDDGRSCMDYDQAEWIDNANGTFTKTDIADKDFNYCLLDLYLMGLLPSSQVGALRILQDPKLVDKDRKIYRATTKQLSIEQIIASCGRRVPATSPRSYRQAFVVVSADPESGSRFATTIDQFRRQFEAQFATATATTTGSRATLSTDIF